MTDSIPTRERAALLILSLEPEAATRLLAALPEQDAVRLGKQIMGTHEIDRDTQREVVQEFSKLLSGSERLLVSGERFAQEVLELANGEKPESNVTSSEATSHDPLGLLYSRIPPSARTRFVEEEHPQTIAFLLASIYPHDAADSLKALEPEQQIEVIQRMAELECVQPSAVDELREILRKMAVEKPSTEPTVEGKDAVAQILNQFSTQGRERLLGDIEALEPGLGDEIRERMFTFEDLASVSARGLQELVKEVPREQLILSLKLADESLKQAVLESISERAANMILEDLESLGPRKRSEVEAAQRAVVDVARRLESEGRLTTRVTDEDILV